MQISRANIYKFCALSKSTNFSTALCWGVSTRSAIETLLLANVCCQPFLISLIISAFYDKIISALNTHEYILKIVPSLYEELNHNILHSYQYTYAVKVEFKDQSLHIRVFIVYLIGSYGVPSVGSHHSRCMVPLWDQSDYGQIYRTTTAVLHFPDNGALASCLLERLTRLDSDVHDFMDTVIMA